MNMLNNKSDIHVIQNENYLLKYLGLSIPVEILAMVIIVAVCCVISIRKLSIPNEALGESQITTVNRKAMITVLILSSLFIAFNSTTMGAAFYFIFNMNSTNDPAKYFDMILTIIRLAVLPINSALNPVVYIFRIEGLNIYTKQLFRRIIPARWRNEVTRNAAVELDRLPAT